eukprot:8942857-Pyramimonas_sp.AAC.1
MSQPPHGALPEPEPPPAALHKIRANTLRITAIVTNLPKELEGRLRVRIPAELEIVARSALTNDDQQRIDPREHQ